MICPYCGKENVSVFSDSVFHNHGFHCEDCDKDFGVNDGSNLLSLEQDLKACYFKKIEKDDHKIVEIQKKEDGIILYPTRFKEQKSFAYKKVNIENLFSTFKKVIFENFFILDWPNSEVIDESKDYYQVILEFNHHETITIQNNDFPPYLAGLDKLFLPFFVESNIW